MPAVAEPPAVDADLVRPEADREEPRETGRAAPEADGSDTEALLDQFFDLVADGLTDAGARAVADFMMTREQSARFGELERRREDGEPLSQAEELALFDLETVAAAGSLLKVAIDRRRGIRKVFNDLGE